jgi:hypothetical protein
VRPPALHRGLRLARARHSGPTPGRMMTWVCSCGIRL